MHKRIETASGEVIEFDAPDRKPGELTAKQRADLDRLFAWFEERDRLYAERKARGEFTPRLVAHPALDKPISKPRQKVRREAIMGVSITGGDV